MDSASEMLVSHRQVRKSHVTPRDLWIYWAFPTFVQLYRHAFRFHQSLLLLLLLVLLLLLLWLLLLLLPATGFCFQSVLNWAACVFCPVNTRFYVIYGGHLRTRKVGAEDRATRPWVWGQKEAKPKFSLENSKLCNSHAFGQTLWLRHPSLAGCDG